jgi:hypothetical protein
LVSSWKEDSPWLPAPSQTKRQEHERSNSRSSKQKEPEQPAFSSDGAVLFKLFKSFRSRDTADTWFQHFAAAVQSAPAWDLDAAEAAAVAAGKRKRGRREPLDERTVLKARFASALHELQKCGLIKCSAANTQAALALVPGLSTVVVERKIYTWV